MMRGVLVLVMVFSAVNHRAAAQRLQIPQTSRHVLENGLSVILMEYRKVPVVHFRLVARGGSAQDPAGLEGLAAAATSLMREGTITRTSTQIAEGIDFVGGSLSAAAGLDYCAVRAEVLRKDLDTGLDLFSDVILHPSFPREELERERKLRVASLDALREDPGTIAAVTFARNVYGSHPYGRQSFGTQSSLQALGREHLVDFYRQTFHPANCVLVVVGDFDSSEILMKVTSAFGSWGGRTGERRLPPYPVQLRGRSIVVVDKPDATQTQIVFGNTSVDIRHPDLFAIRIASTIFGGGFTSRLIDELRIKRSLTYGATCSFSANLSGGTYAISTFTKNETVGETVEVILEELRKYRHDGVSREEYGKARNYIRGSFARSLQAPEALAMRLTDTEIYGFEQDYLETYIERLQSVSLEDVQRSIKQHFHLEDLLMVFVGPARETRTVLERYGPVRTVALKDAVQ